MSKMYCPQCGREQELESDVRFCRYCGLSLSDTKDTLHGYMTVKREGYKYTNLSYVLLLLLFCVQYFGLIPWRSLWGGDFWLILTLGFIFGLWFMGNWVVDKPAKYVKGQRRGETAGPIEIETSAQKRGLPPSPGATIPIAGGLNVDTSEVVKPSGTREGTTRRLTDRHPPD